MTDRKLYTQPDCFLRMNTTKVLKWQAEQHLALFHHESSVKLSPKIGILRRLEFTRTEGIGNIQSNNILDAGKLRE